MKTQTNDPFKAIRKITDFILAVPFGPNKNLPGNLDWRMMKVLHCQFLCWSMICSLVFSCITDLALAQTPLPPEISYDIVYVRAPRYGDQIRTKIPEVHTPMDVEAGSDLVLLHPDGSEEILVSGGLGAVLDPYVSFDGKWVFYAKVHDQTDLNDSRKDAARSGSDIFKINLETREIIQLTFQEWTPNTGVGNWSNNPLNSDPSGTNYLGYGIFNLGPCPLPNGKLMFTSSRNGFLPNKSFTFPNLQLFVMDQDGRNVEEVGHLNLGSALHPTILMDGRVMFSSYEGQGLRDSRVWSLWSIWPDGSRWGPLMSGFAGAFVFHWQAQLSDGSIVLEDYYNVNNAGFGAFLKFPATVPPGRIPFGSPDPDHPSNPPIALGWHGNGNVEFKRFPFSPYGLESLTPFTIAKDRAAPFVNGTGTERTGKVTQPSGAPNNDLLLVWSPGPAHRDDIPVYDAGLYLLVGGIPIHDHRELILLKNDPNYNEQQPRAVLPYNAIYGIAEPQAFPWLPNDGTLHQALPEGTPYGLIGTSTFYRRDSKPGEGKTEFNGLEPFNTTDSSSNINWEHQGADAGLYNEDEMYAVRIVALEPTSHLSYGPNERRSHSTNSNWRNHADERMRILGEIPLRKFDTSGNVITDADGNPDTSFLAKVPADVPFTFQTIDKDGLVLNASQTWHQVRPGEVRHDCGGCHAHSQAPLNFSTTAAAQPNYRILDLANTTPVLSKTVDNQPTLQTLPQGALDVEYYRDIKPILQRSCVQCHSLNGTQEAGLVLDDEAIVEKYENTYNRLADDSGGQYGIPPLVSSGWRGTNASRYIRKFQSRRSLLIWKIFGRRLDGWSNADHPSAAVPGDPTTLPNGGDKDEINLSDLDYTGTIMPPPGSGLPGLTEDEKILFARWVDMGAPITSPDPTRQTVGWFADELRPTLTLSNPRTGVNTNALETIRVGMHDFNTGLDLSSFSVTADFAVNSQTAGAELAGQFQQTDDHVWSLQLTPGIQSLNDGHITVKVKDHQGNWSEINRHFSVVVDGQPPDTTPPTILAPADVSVTVTSVPATVTLGQATAEDLESGITSIVNDAPVPLEFGEGQTTVTWTATNGGGLSNTATQTVTVTVIPTVMHPLSVTVMGTGSGTVTTNPPGGTCSLGVCDYQYPTDTVVSLSASAASQSTFEGWSGGNCEGSRALTCTVTMTQAESVTASFSLGSPPPATGHIVVDPAHPAWLTRDGGNPFFLCGPGDPEGFLYRGSENPDGTRTGDQLALIHKLAASGANGLYFQFIRSHGGDGDSTHNPFNNHDPAQGLNQAVLDQWEIWFTAMDEAGILIYAFFFDDSSSVWAGGDTVPQAEKDFLEALVTRFKHHKHLVWVIAEEYQESFSSLRVSNMAAIVRAADPIHPVAVHKLNSITFEEFVDDPNIDQFAIQHNVSTAQGLHDGMVTAFAEAAGRYNLNMSEAAGHGTGLEARQKNWGVAMGGAYVMVLGWDIANTAVADLEDCGRLVSFMESTNFVELSPRDDLAFGGTQYVLGDPTTHSFILYASTLAGSLGVEGLGAGTYDLQWLDILSGTTVNQVGIAITGGDTTFSSPTGIGEELAVWVRPNQGATPLPDTTPPTITTPPDVAVTVPSVPVTVTLGQATAEDPESGITSIVRDGPVPPDFPEGTTTVMWTATNGEGLMATATQTVTVTVIPPLPAAYFDNFDDGDLSEYGQIGGNWSTVSESGKGMVLRQTTNDNTILYPVGEQFSGSYQVQAEIWNEDNDAAGVAFRVNTADADNFYSCSATADNGFQAGLWQHVNDLTNTPTNLLAGTTWTYVRSRWYTVTITVDAAANAIHCQWESAEGGLELELTAVDPDPLATGSIGIRLSSEDNFKGDRLQVSPLGPPDTIAPEVTLTSPTSGTSTSDFDLNYTVADEGGVRDCGYLLDGTSIVLPTCANSSVTGVALGTHELQMFATDGAGNTGVSTPVVFTVTADTSLPSWNPVPVNQTILDGELLSYRVNAVDNVAIASYAVDDTASFTMDPATGLLVSNLALPEGNYPLTLSVQDIAGNVATAPVTVTVVPPAPPVAYFDNFDDGNLSEYRQLNGNWSTVSEPGRGQVLRQTTNAITLLYAAAENFSGSYQVKAEIWNEDNDTAGVAFRVNPTSPNTFYQCLATADNGSQAGIYRQVDSLSNSTQLAGESWTYIRSRWYTVTITVDQNTNTLHCQWESAETGIEFEVTAIDPEPLGSGSIGIRLSSEDNFKADLLEVKTP